MNHITIATRGKLAGDFVLRNEPDVSLGDYLEVVYTGPQTSEEVHGIIVYLFPLMICHSLLHDKAHYEASLVAVSIKVATFLNGLTPLTQQPEPVGRPILLVPLLLIATLLNKRFKY